MVEKPFSDVLIHNHLNSLAKPPGSLGRLETLAAVLCRIQSTLKPQSQPRSAVLFAADHGVVDAGVTAWPQSVTRAIVQAVLQGGAASQVLSRSTVTPLRIVDVGMVGPELPPHPSLRSRRIRSGSRNLADEPAMTAEEFHAAWQVGEGEADQDSNAGMRLVLGGEMGIGNSTPAAALTALLTDTDVSRVVGPGAGVDAHGFMRKQSVVQSAVERERERFPTEPIPALAALAGYEIVALAGYYATAGAKHKMTILLDGFIATSAALLAAHLVPECSCYFLAAHRSAEPGHTIALRHLHLTPILDGWDLRLGEGTGALLVVPFLDAACQICCNMATLNDLGARE